MAKGSSAVHRFSSLGRCFDLVHFLASAGPWFPRGEARRRAVPTLPCPGTARAPAWGTSPMLRARVTSFGDISGLCREPYKPTEHRQDAGPLEPESRSSIKRQGDPAASPCRGLSHRRRARRCAQGHRHTHAAVDALRFASACSARKCCDYVPSGRACR